MASLSASFTYRPIGSTAARATRLKYGSSGTRETDTPAVMTVSGNRVVRRNPTVTQVSSSIVSCSQPAATASSPMTERCEAGGDPGRVVYVRLTGGTEHIGVAFSGDRLGRLNNAHFPGSALGVLGAARTMHEACVACCTPSHVRGPDWRNRAVLGRAAPTGPALKLRTTPALLPGVNHLLVVPLREGLPSGLTADPSLARWVTGS